MHERTKNLIMLLSLIVVLLLQVAQFSRGNMGGAVIPPTTTPSWVKLVISLTPTPTATATPWVKQDILVIMMPHGFQVWTDSAEEDRLVVDAVEGVIDTKIFNDDYMIYVRLDPRFDKFLVAKDVMTQLAKNRGNIE